MSHTDYPCHTVLECGSVCDDFCASFIHISPKHDRFGTSTNFKIFIIYKINPGMH